MRLTGLYFFSSPRLVFLGPKRGGLKLLAKLRFVRLSLVGSAFLGLVVGSVSVQEEGKTRHGVFSCFSFLVYLARCSEAFFVAA